jgi:hypothetical protein
MQQKHCFTNNADKKIPDWQCIFKVKLKYVKIFKNGLIPLFLIMLEFGFSDIMMKSKIKDIVSLTTAEFLLWKIYVELIYFKSHIKFHGIRK